ncbi:hypothetical protein [Lactobacillus gallinarum]|uniref:hypothetical protein n=1 Tax=Lactobacillus gallinarum TaxID=52242 RepID=UPI0024B8A6C5|nr:hypothetical protein [Lactobacillus gallinarum]
MKKKLLKIILPLLMLSFLFIFNKNTVSASYLNGNSYTDMCTRHVKVIKPIRVYKVRTGTCEAKNKFHKYGKIKKGAKIWISHYLMSTGGGWVVISAHKYYSTRRIFFFAANGHARANWYRRIA